MILALARCIMVVAVRCLGDYRRDWARAMETEFRAAADAGEPLRFATGCLIAALREAPMHDEGRFLLANHVLATGVLLPTGALLLSSVLSGSPFIAADDGTAAGLFGSGAPQLFVNEGNVAGLPLMALLTAALGAGHTRMAWLVLDRDWERVAVLGRMAAALLITTLIFSGIFFPGNVCAVPQAALVALELSAVCSLVRWHEALPGPAVADPH